MKGFGGEKHRGDVDEREKVRSRVVLERNSAFQFYKSYPHMAPEGSSVPKTKKCVRSTNSASATSRITGSKATTTTESVEATNHQE
uniref:Uncharacterized protein n=1 Tax=Triticum urartu TaxID=4572 RepID=A0A8R7V1R9_TRIUA